MPEKDAITLIKFFRTISAYYDLANLEIIKVTLNPFIAVVEPIFIKSGFGCMIGNQS